MPPLIESLTKDGLANLLRTGSAHATPRFVEFDALRFELKPAEIKNAPHGARKVIDDILMMYSKNTPGEYAIPVPHQLEIRSVVARDIIDAVGELLALGKQLLKIAETARHRFTPRVDDPGIWQHQANEPQVPEVVRHLVDEEGLAGAVDPGACNILLAELQKIPMLQLCEYPRVAGIVRMRVAAPKQFDNLLDVGEFLRAFDLRVRSQDLFDESRP